MFRRRKKSQPPTPHAKPPAQPVDPRVARMREQHAENATRADIERVLSDKEAQQALRDMQRYGPDRPYWQRGKLAASRYPVSEELTREEAAEARLNIASILSVPDDQLSDEIKMRLVPLAAAGEDVYAYPPVSRPDQPEPEWNIWFRGQRIRAVDFEEEVQL